MNWRDYIVSDPDVLLGKPTIRGTRISVELILGWLSKGWTFDTIIEAYPFVTRNDILAALAFTADMLHDERYIATHTKHPGLDNFTNNPPASNSKPESPHASGAGPMKTAETPSAASMRMILSSGANPMCARCPRSVATTPARAGVGRSIRSAVSIKHCYRTLAKDGRQELKGPPAPGQVLAGCECMLTTQNNIETTTTK